jgi:hypothetical protein
VQVDADIKVMSEFLVHLQGDSIRNMSKTSHEHSEHFSPFALI